MEPAPKYINIIDTVVPPLTRAAVVMSQVLIGSARRARRGIHGLVAIIRPGSRKVEVGRGLGKVVNNSPENN